MKIEVPDKIFVLHEEIVKAVNDSTEVMEIRVAAKLLGLNKDTLRKIIYNERCPFAIGLKEKYANGIARVSTLGIYNYFTQGALYKNNK